jgi:hypothetical protein
MPLWSNTPPDAATKPGLPLVRVPRGARTIYLVTSEDLLGCYTHFWGGRTLPCDEPNCKACLEDVPARWHAYVAVLQAGTMKHCILETTAGPSLALVDYRNTYKTLRGCRIDASRQGANANARIHFHCTPLDLAKLHLPPPPDLHRVLATIWRLKLPDASLTTPRPPRRTTDTLSDVADQIVQPDPTTMTDIFNTLVPNGRNV